LDARFLFIPFSGFSPRVRKSAISLLRPATKIMPHSQGQEGSFQGERASFPQIRALDETEKSVLQGNIENFDTPARGTK